MFKTIDEVPTALVQFYEENDEGEVVEKLRGEIQDNVALLLERNADKDLVDKFLGFVNEGIRWEFHDQYIAWLDKEPKSDDEKYQEKDGEDNLLYSFDDDHSAWLALIPVVPVERKLEDYSGYIKWLKLQGVMFEGKRCSATKEDMWGLASVSPVVKAGTPINFEFDGGDTLTLTKDNIGDFEKVWIPFRMQFF